MITFLFISVITVVVIIFTISLCLYIMTFPRQNHESQVDESEIILEKEPPQLPEPYLSEPYLSEPYCLLKMKKGPDIRFKGSLVLNMINDGSRYRIWKSANGNKWLACSVNDLTTEYVIPAIVEVGERDLMRWLLNYDKRVATELVTKFPELEKYTYREIG